MHDDIDTRDQGLETMAKGRHAVIGPFSVGTQRCLIVISSGCLNNGAQRREALQQDQKPCPYGWIPQEKQM